MVCFKLLVVPLLFLSLLGHGQSSAASHKSKSKSSGKKPPKLGLRTLSRSGLSVSRWKSKSGNRTALTSRSSGESEKCSALTLRLCPETPSLEHQITVEVIGRKDTDGSGTLVTLGDQGGRSPYNIKMEDTVYPQKTITKIKISGSSEDQVVCVETLVVDVTIMIDQPTEFKQTCPETPNVDDLPCKQFGDAVLTPFVCPAKLTQLLESKTQINSVPEETPTDPLTPPVYDITKDMLQASAAIAEGVTEGLGNVVKSRIRAYKAALKTNPMGSIASVVDNVGSFIGALGPVFSIFAGISSIVTTFLTPNPFDELAKHLDKQFERVHDHISELQFSICDLEKLVVAEGSKLAMAAKIESIRYAVRNYGYMMNRLSVNPVCGKDNLLNLHEVDEFFLQYRRDNVDNKLLDLYSVDFGEVTEAGQGLLKPYAKAYCHSHPNYLGKFANELSYYGFAGSLAHFAYKNLACIKRGNEDCDESDEDRDEWLTKLHKFLKKAEVFKVAADNLPEALYLDVKSELEELIEDETKKVSPNTSPVPGLMDKILTLIVNKVNRPGDWTNTCVAKVQGRDGGTLIVEVAEVTGARSLSFSFTDPQNVPWHKTLTGKRFYVHKQNTDRSYKSVRITCGHQDPDSQIEYCHSNSVNVPSSSAKDRLIFLMFSPKLHQLHNQMPSMFPKPPRTVFIGSRDVYAYYDNGGDSGMEGKVHVNCWTGCGLAWETQFALIDNHRETRPN